jgi:hypothetical protein
MCALSPCGIDCTPCPLRTADHNEEAARSLVPWFKAEGWLDENEGVTELMAKGPFCRGCRGDRSIHWSANCAVMLCCIDRKNLNNCSECPGFPCQEIEEWADMAEQHREPFNRLLRMRENR